MGEPARNDPGAVERSALDGAAWDSAPRSPCRPAEWGATPGRVPHGVAVLGPRRQGVEEAAAGAGLHHQRLEAGDQAGLGEQRGLELWVQDRCPSSGPAARPPSSHWPVRPPAPTPCLSPPTHQPPPWAPPPSFMPPRPRLTCLVQEAVYSSCTSTPPVLSVQCPQGLPSRCTLSWGEGVWFSSAALPWSSRGPRFGHGGQEP